MEGVFLVADREIEVIDFSQKEADFIADILQSAFVIADLSGGQNDSLKLFDTFIDALDDGKTIRISEN